MARPQVLAIGLDPAHAEPALLAQFPVAALRAHIDAQLQRVREAGYEVDACLVGEGATAEAMVAAALSGRAYDCVLFGAGLRLPPERLLLFETLINLVHRQAPGARICFNTSPADTTEAIRRWARRGGVTE